jgi:hypothetical protein
MKTTDIALEVLKDYPVIDQWCFTNGELERYTHMILLEAAERVEMLRGYSGYCRGKIVDTPAWNYAVENCASVIRGMCHEG